MDPAHLNKLFSISNWLFLIPCYCQNSIGDLWNTLVPTWTTTTSEGYICLTAHFVDENWKLVSCILNFCRMKPPHTGIALEAALFDCLKQWGIDKNIFSITLDNASANDNMKDHLRNHLRMQSNLMGNAEFFSCQSIYGRFLLESLLILLVDLDYMHILWYQKLEWYIEIVVCLLCTLILFEMNSDL